MPLCGYRGVSVLENASAPGLLDLPQIRAQPRGLPVQSTSLFTPSSLFPDPTLGVGGEAPFPFTSAPGPRRRPSSRPRLSDVQHLGHSESWVQDTRWTGAGRSQLGGGAWGGALGVARCMSGAWPEPARAWPATGRGPDLPTWKLP